jgi:hypothetical protein
MLAQQSPPPGFPLACYVLGLDDTQVLLLWHSLL